MCCILIEEEEFMIQIQNMTKRFDDICAVNNISLEVPEGIMFGLLGTNGAGKTTLLRMLAGILEADSGGVLVDGDPLEEAKKKIFYLPDDPYYFPNASMEQMAQFYKDQYPDTDLENVNYMAEALELDVKLPLRTFSKGMKRQAFLILALCAGTKYLLCDEVFDGLDPIVAEVMKNLFRQEMKERKFTAVVASHRLNELEDMCGNIAILHRGGLVTAGDMRGRAEHVRKYQCVFADGSDMDRLEQELGKELDVVRFHADGSFVTLVVRDAEGNAESNLRARDTELIKEAPMSLEEIFIAEMEGKDYDIRKVLH